MVADTKVFISYSRRNRDRVQIIHDRLSTKEDLTVYRDTDDILPTEEWKGRLERLILESDVIVFALSPDSAKSEVCAWELESAESLNKKIIPVVVENVDGDVPDVVSKLNYVFLTKDDDPALALKAIEQAIDLDIDWIREHTRLGELADRWDKAAKLGAQPLRGKELEAAEQWLLGQPKNSPQPTELHRRYIFDSRRALARRQRFTVIGSIAAALVVGVLGAFAWVQREAAIENMALAVSNEQRAQRALREATDSANRLVFGLAQDFKELSVPIVVVDGILKIATDLQDSLATNFPDDPDLQHSRAAAIMSIGHLKSASGEDQVALDYFLKSLAIQRKLVATEADNTLWRKNLAATLENVGRTKTKTRDFLEAAAALEEALEIQRELVEQFPEYAEYLHDLSSTLVSVGDLNVDSGDPLSALSVFGESLEITRKLLEEGGWSEKALLSHAINLDRFARAAGNIDRPKLALKLYKESMEIRKNLSANDPNNTTYLRHLLLSNDKVGKLAGAAGDHVTAFAALEEKVGLARKLTVIDPNNMQWQHDLAVALLNYGDVQNVLGKSRVAHNYFEEALSIRRKLADHSPTDMQEQYTLVSVLSSIAAAYANQLEFEVAISFYREMVNRAERSVEQFPKEEAFALKHESSKEQLAKALGSLSYLKTLELEFERAEALAREAIDLAPDLEWLRINLAHSLLFQSGGEQEALELYLADSGEVAPVNSQTELTLQDFEEMRSKGLTNPLMDKVERLLLSQP